MRSALARMPPTKGIRSPDRGAASQVLGPEGDGGVRRSSHDSHGDTSVVGRGDHQASMRSRNTVDAMPCVGSAAIPHAVASALLSAIGGSIPLGHGRIRSALCVAASVRRQIRPMPARLLLLCLLFRSSWLTVEDGRHSGAAGVLHRRATQSPAGSRAWLVAFRRGSVVGLSRRVEASAGTARCGTLGVG